MTQTNRYDNPGPLCEALPERAWYAGAQDTTCQPLAQDDRYKGALIDPRNGR